MYPGAHAETQPGKPALIMAGTGRNVTYAELDERSNRLAQWWHAAGLRGGDGVAMLLTNTAEVLEIYWAALRSGLYVTAINYNLSADEASYIVEDAAIRSLVVSADLGDLATQVAERCPRVDLKLAIGPVRGYGDYEAALAGSEAAPLAHEPRGADMLYSSGTTGRPKGVKLPIPGTLIAEDPGTIAPLVQGLWGFGPDTVYLSPAPMYHAAPLRFCAATHSLGGTVVMMERFDAKQALELIAQHRVTHSQWVPTMFVRMLKLDEADRRADVSSLRVAIHAAAPCPVEVKAQMIEWWGPIIAEYYASTESNGMTFVSTQDWLARPGTVGRAALGVVRICREDGTLCEVGEPGDVYFERDFLPFEYHNDPTRTKAAQHPEHPTWTTVGDMGYLDADGYLFLTDRKAFMIISGGVNIYPQEIEGALALHPAVEDVAVIGVPDPEMGESVKAFVQPAATARAGPGPGGRADGLSPRPDRGFQDPAHLGVPHRVTADAHRKVAEGPVEGGEVGVTRTALGVGIVGLSAERGWAGTAHVPAINALPGLELRAASASSPASGKLAAEKHGVPIACADAAELAAHPDVDLVVVTVKVPYHAELVGHALAHGKHVLCEWPLGNGTAEAEALAAEAARKDLRAWVGLQARATPAIRYAADLVAAGELGEVLSTTMVGVGGEWGGTVRPGSEYLIDAANGATLLTVPVGHAVDALAWTLGEFAEVSATLATRQRTVHHTVTGEAMTMTAPDQVAITGTLAGGAVVNVHFRGGNTRDQKLRWIISGTEGELVFVGVHGHLQFGMVELLRATGDDKVLTPAEIPGGYELVPQGRGGPSYTVAQAYAGLLRDLEDGGSRTPTFADALVRHRMLDAAQRSSDTGTRQLVT